MNNYPNYIKQLEDQANLVSEGKCHYRYSYAFTDFMTLFSLPTLIFYSI